MKLINTVTTTVSLDEDEKQILAQAHLIINELYHKLANNNAHSLFAKEDSYGISIAEINLMSQNLNALSNNNELTVVYKISNEEN